MIFNKITNEYKKNNTAVRDTIYKICGVTICHTKATTADINVVQCLTTVRKRKKIKGFTV